MVTNNALYVGDLKEDFHQDIFKNSEKNIEWKNIGNSLDFAFQLIVNIHTGVCYAYELVLKIGD